ncbi:MAG TPA: DegT/DnrJ/EryC1/StrS family aminotransferase [Roseiflexaceae bacterium]|mgnify:CR=1 FL=1|nr:DegT/DnrJ/EryC1/StrS family aminotransferase [Roseiflexaceae bacterium]
MTSGTMPWEAPLAIDGGTPVIDRVLNRYKGAALIGEEEKQAVLEVLESQSLFRYYGPKPLFKVADFEKRFAAYVGAPHALGSSSGTAALRLGLAGLGIGPGDDVLVPAVTFIASVGAIVAARARPIFVEVDAYMQLDPADLAARLTPRTKAIMPVHLNGVTADMDPIMTFAREHGLLVIEDAAQSCGSFYKGRHVGTIGDVGCFSFQLEKNITSGEGGVLVTSDAEVFRRAAIYSDQGGQFWTSHAGVRDNFGGQPVIGENLRMSEITGAILGCQIAKLDVILEHIERNTAIVRNAIAEIEGIDVPPAIPDRDRHAVGTIFYLPDAATAESVAKALQAEGVPAGKVYGGLPVYAAQQILNQWTITGGCPFHCTHAFPEPIRYHMGMCPQTEDRLARAVGISVGPFFSEEDLDDLIGGVRKVAHHLLRN